MTKTAGRGESGPLADRHRYGRVGCLAAAVAIALTFTWPPAPGRAGAWLLATALSGALVTAALVLPWHRWPVPWQAAPALAFFPVVALLGHTGATSVFVPLAFLPILWLCLYHGRRLLVAALTVLPAVLAMPFAGGEITDVRRLVFAYLVAWFVGLAGQRLVNRLRGTAAALDDAVRQARADREFMRAVLDTTECLLLVIDEAGTIMLVNRRFEEVTGYPSDEVLGRPVWAVGVRERDVPRARETLARALSSTVPVSYEADWPTRDGGVRRIAWTGTPLGGADGGPPHLVATGLDVTEQRRTERLISSVLAAATEQAIFAVDTTGVFTLFNVGAERLLGYSADELVGRANAAILHLREEIDRLAEELGTPGAGPEVIVREARAGSGTTREWTFVRKDGTHVPACVSVTGIRNDDNELTGYLAVARDITAERRAAAAMSEALVRERGATERLRKLDKARTDFVATVSHELRTPLTSIIGNLEVVLDGDCGPLSPHQSTMLSAVDRNSRRLLALVSDLLLLSGIDAGTVRARRADLDVRDLVDGALDAVGAQRVAPDVGLTVDVPTGLRVSGDREQLERVLVNLVANAIKFTPPGGRVTVRAAAVDGAVRIRVADTGMGVPADEVAHVFDRFFRSSRSQSQASPGSGLGLAICRSIVTEHGGAITLASAEGEGTTVTVTLAPARVRAKG